MEYLQGRMANAQVFLVKQHKKKVGSGPSLLRALLLGPLSTAANFAARYCMLFDYLLVVPQLLRLL